MTYYSFYDKVSIWERRRRDPLENGRKAYRQRRKMYSRTRLSFIAVAATIVAAIAWLAAWMIDAYTQDAMHLAYRVSLACDWTQEAYYCDEAAITATKYMDAQDFVLPNIMIAILWTGGLVAIAIVLWAFNSVVKITRVAWVYHRHLREMRELTIMSRLARVEMNLEDARAILAWHFRDMEIKPL